MFWNENCCNQTSYILNHALGILKIDKETPKKRKLEDSLANTKKKKSGNNKLNYRLPAKEIPKKDVHTKKFKPAHIKKKTSKY